MATIHETLKYLKEGFTPVGFMQASGVILDAGGPGSGRKSGSISEDLAYKMHQHILDNGYKQTAKLGSQNSYAKASSVKTSHKLIVDPHKGEWDYSGPAGHFKGSSTSTLVSHLKSMK